MELRGPPAGNRAAFGNDQGCRAPDLPQSESQPHRAVATLSSDGKGKTGKLRPGRSRALPAVRRVRPRTGPAGYEAGGKSNDLSPQGRLSLPAEGRVNPADRKSVV